jgi:hypothetical protein
MQRVYQFVRANRFPLAVAGVWLVSVWATILLAQHFFGQSLSLTRWAGDWDGGWYKSIVEQGYATSLPGYQVNLGFFPLLPVLTWLLKTATGLPTVWAGMVITTASFASTLIILYHLVWRYFTLQTARWTLCLLAFNPFSLYFGMMYTESVFLLLAVSCFWFLLQKRWWMAALFAGLATATRSVGVALAVAVVVSYLFDAKRKKWGDERRGSTRLLPAAVPGEDKSWGGPLGRTPSVFLLTALSFSGLIIFSLYLWQHTGNPTAYSTAQSYWPDRGGPVNLLQEQLHLLTPTHINKEYLIRVMWELSAVVGVIGFVMLLKLRQTAMAIYAGIALALPMLFGTTSAMNRYVLVVFPVFIAYAAWLVKQPVWLRRGGLVLLYAGFLFIMIIMVHPDHLFIG